MARHSAGTWRAGILRALHAGDPDGAAGLIHLMAADGHTDDAAEVASLLVDRYARSTARHLVPA